MHRLAAYAASMLDIVYRNTARRRDALAQMAA
jgi:hypothetical protein